MIGISSEEDAVGDSVVDFEHRRRPCEPCQGRLHARCEDQYTGLIDPASVWSCPCGCQVNGRTLEWAAVEHAQTAPVDFAGRVALGAAIERSVSFSVHTSGGRRGRR